MNISPDLNHLKLVEGSNRKKTSETNKNTAAASSILTV